MLNPDGVDLHIGGMWEHFPLRERVLIMNGGSSDFESWQSNARGVDLNHNYNALFKEYKTLERERHIKNVFLQAQRNRGYSIIRRADGLVRPGNR
mgnify:CR=1 FL=1